MDSEIQRYTLDNQWPSEKEVLNSNNVENIVEYAKEARSQVAIDKARELLEFARKTGEEVVQNYLKSFEECKKEGVAFFEFEKMESGILALSQLETMPEPFKSQAKKKLEEYKEDLKRNTDLFEAHKDEPEVIWKKVFDLDYNKISEAGEKLKVMLFQRAGETFKKYYKEKELRAEQDPFAISLFAGDAKSFNEAIELYSDRDIKDAHNKIDGFSFKDAEGDINVLNVANSSFPKAEEIIEKNARHELEHAVHRKTSPFEKKSSSAESLANYVGFEKNIILLNQCMVPDFQGKLENAKDEVFAYLKSNFSSENAKFVLFQKGPDALYDYNKTARDVNNEINNNNVNISEVERGKLRNGINFLQAEYERVLQNMIEIIYDGNKSVEFFRNVPIKELWKYSEGKFNRQDFLIREFKL